MVASRCEVREPLLGMTGGPDWWHHHGIKMRLTACDSELKTLTIASSAATLKISRITIGDRDCWKVEWKVVQSRNECSTGTILFSNEDLADAFNLKDREIGSFDRWLISRYGGDRARQFRYIGFGDYLNIPCPGTGHDGDPNISIEINGAMQGAVDGLLS